MRTIPLINKISSTPFDFSSSAFSTNPGTCFKLGHTHTQKKKELSYINHAVRNSCINGGQTKFIWWGDLYIIRIMVNFEKNNKYHPYTLTRCQFNPYTFNLNNLLPAGCICDKLNPLLKIVLKVSRVRHYMICLSFAIHPIFFNICTSICLYLHIEAYVVS